MHTRIIYPQVDMEADRRYTPGPCVVYQPLPARTHGGPALVPKVNGKSLATILAKERYEASLKEQRQLRNAEIAKAATAAQAPRFKDAWARLQRHGQVVNGEVTVHALASAARVSAQTLFSRMYRMRITGRKEAPPRGLVWVNEAAACKLLTYHAGNQRGRIHNPKIKKEQSNG